MNHTMYCGRLALGPLALWLLYVICASASAACIPCIILNIHVSHRESSPRLLEEHMLGGDHTSNTP